MRLTPKSVLRTPGLGVIGILVIIYILMLALKPLPFLSVSNQLNIARDTAVLAIVCVGMTIVIIGRGIDLSVGSITGLSGGVCAYLLLHNAGLVVAVLAALVTGVLIGALNGFLITRFGLSDFIVTLGSLHLFRGIYLAWANGLPFIGYMNNELWWLATGKVFGIQVTFVADILIIIVFTFVLRISQFGTDVFAMGSNSTAAEMVGVRTRRVKFITYAISGLLCAVAGLFLMVRLTAITPHTGEGMELNAIAAVLLGGTSLSGGRGTIYASVLGALLISLVGNLVTLLGINQFLSQTVVGVIILFAVGLDVLAHRVAVTSVRANTGLRAAKGGVAE